MHAQPLLYRLFPFLRWWPMVNQETLRADALAGLTGALIVLPQGVAFAIIADLPPQYGLYAAMVPAIIAALFGSSWHLVSGPTTAISIAVFASVAPHATPGTPEFISLVLTLTFLVGLFELLLGLARMGTLIDLEKGVFFGVLLSLLFYLSRTSRPQVQAVVPDPEPGSYHYIDASGHPECPQLKMVRINGSLFFGAVDHVQQHLHAIDTIQPTQKHVLIVAPGINFIDIAGAEMLAHEARRRKTLGGGPYFYRLKETAQKTLEKTGALDQIGRENLFPVRSRPIETLYPKLDPELCARCDKRIFHVCRPQAASNEPLPGPLQAAG
jgi:MFS superfamily sulfate permease-like transporter